MYKVSEEDRKEFLNYLAKKPYIEVAGLVARIAGWQKAEEPKQNKDDRIKNAPSRRLGRGRFQFRAIFVGFQTGLRKSAQQRVPVCSFANW